jgi:phosphoribosylglycinamide formyltransferase-1
VTKPKIVVLASGSGSLFAAIASAVSTGELPIEISALITDCSCPAQARAREFGIEVVQIEPGDNRDLWNARLASKLMQFAPDLVVSAGFMRIIGEPTISTFANRIINTHPALLPNFPGAHAVRDALAAGVTETGCTVHWVDTGMDTGTVIAQRSLVVQPGESEVDLHERIKVLERELVVETIKELLVEDAK